MEQGQPAASAQSEKPSMKKWMLLLMAWSAAFMLLTSVWCGASLQGEFGGPHACVSAHFCMMAHNFAEKGIVGLGGVPVQNYPPEGAEADLVTHWPPLFPMVLSLFFRLFGESESSARLLMSFILFANTILLYLLLRSWRGTTAALFGVIGLLCQPIIMMFGLLVLHINLAMFWVLAALICYTRASAVENQNRAWKTAGLVFVFLSVWTSWEPVLAYFGLLVAGLLLKDRSLRRLGAWYFAGSVVAVVSVFALYFVQNPDRFVELVHVVSFRLGLAGGYHPGFAKTQPKLIAVLFRYLKYFNLLDALSLLALGAVVVFGIINRRRLVKKHIAAAVFGLLSMPTLWFVFLRGHGYFHEYELVVAMPVLAICVGLAGEALWRWASANLPDVRHVRTVLLVMLLLVPALMSKNLLVHTVVQLRAPRPVEPIVKYAQQIRTHTPEGAVVLSPFGNMLVSYYSKRRNVRDLKDEAAVVLFQSKLNAVFPGDAPVYLAVMPEQEQTYEGILASYPQAARDSHLLLARLR